MHSTQLMRKRKRGNSLYELLYTRKRKFEEIVDSKTVFPKTKQIQIEKQFILIGTEMVECPPTPPREEFDFYF
jgi:hypothetical protein